MYEGRNKMKYLPRFSFLTLSLVFMLMVSLGAQTTIEFEAEDFDYNADPVGTWLVIDDANASGGKSLKQINTNYKTGIFVGWKFETTSATDTVYYVWYKMRVTVGSNREFSRVWINWDQDVNTDGTTWPNQGEHAWYADEYYYDMDTTFHWYQGFGSYHGITADSLIFQPGQHELFWRQRDLNYYACDKIIITNDLTFRPEYTIEEWEAEGWPISTPLEVIAEAGASGDSVVATQGGSGTISNVDLLNGNLDIGVRDGRVAEDTYYLWMLVNLPSESANSYWIGMGDEGIIPPSWEGAVTSGYEWRQLTDDLGAVKPLYIVTEDFNAFSTIRLKQQEEGTKIDKYLLTNDASYVPTNPGGSGEKTTIEFEAEDFDYNEDPDATWLVIDDVNASGGQGLKQINTTIKAKKFVGWKFETTSATDTVYYVWYKMRVTPESNREFHRIYFNWDQDTSVAGTDWPFQEEQGIYAHEYYFDKDTSYHWYQGFTSYHGITADSLIFHPGQHDLFWRQRDNNYYVCDKIIITNDLTFRPEYTIEEWEAEGWPISTPLEVIAEAGASGDSVVATQGGSGTISNVDLLNGNLDIGVRDGRVAEDTYYLWMLVNLPSESANSYWIGMGDEGIIPPSWEGAVTSGYEWRQLTDDLGAVKPLYIVTEDFNAFSTIRLKQQEEGTKIDKYLLTNDPDYVPMVTAIDDGLSNGTQPRVFSVAQNYPNPFNPSTTIAYSLPKTAEVEVSVYNILGKKVVTLVNGVQQAGNQEVKWNGLNTVGNRVSTGIYFYMVKYQDKVEHKKMLLLK